MTNKQTKKLTNKKKKTPEIIKFILKEIREIKRKRHLSKGRDSLKNHRQQEKIKEILRKQLMSNPVIKVELIGEEGFDQLPKGTPNSVGYDLIYTGESKTLEKGEWGLFETGIKMEMPDGVEATIRPRSGLALKGLTVLNSPGTIDPDYRGEIKVILINLSNEPYEVKKGDKIAQMTFHRILKVSIRMQKVRRSTKRGTGGFGSTGR